MCRLTSQSAAAAGLLKTAGANKDAPVPLRLFELSDVVLVDPASSTGTRNCRRLAAVHVARESGFEIIHGLLNRLMEKLGVEVGGALSSCSADAYFAAFQAAMLSKQPCFPSSHGCICLR